MSYGFRFTGLRAAAILMAGTGLVLALASTGSTAPALSDAERLLAAEKDWAKAAADGDADRFAGYMADEYLELSWEAAAAGVAAHWSATSKKDWVKSLRQRTKVYDSVELRNLTVHLQGALASVTGEYSQRGTDGAKDNSASGVYVDTWLKRGGRWLIVSSVFP